MQTIDAQPLELFEQGITRTIIKEMANRAVESVLEQGNPLIAAEGIKGMEEFIKAVKEDRRFKDYVIEEMRKYNGDCTTKNGTKINPYHGGGKYDFSVCNDPVLKDLEAKIEERKKFLKGVPKKGMDVVDESTGEVTTVYPPNPPAPSDSYAVMLAK